MHNLLSSASADGHDNFSGPCLRPHSKLEPPIMQYNLNIGQPQKHKFNLKYIHLNQHNSDLLLVSPKKRSQIWQLIKAWWRMVTAICTSEGIPKLYMTGQITKVLATWLSVHQCKYFCGVNWTLHGFGVIQSKTSDMNMSMGKIRMNMSKISRVLFQRSDLLLSLHI